MFDHFHLIAPLAAFLIGLGAIWTIRRIALAVGFVDNPDQRRKLHCARSRSAEVSRSGWQPGRAGPSACSAARDSGAAGMRLGLISALRSRRW